ncbi:T9SS type A sorting domain-containing protein [Cloacibacterium sp.]|uniref:NHL repeat-containing protein n=1 Tax=Cloacibacterium sp. TaxID=1913682 RepID=UPI0039E262C4
MRKLNFLKPLAFMMMLLLGFIATKAQSTTKINSYSPNYPQCVAVDKLGMVYAIDENGVIKKMNSNGRNEVYLGLGNFVSPSGIEIDASGNIYVIDEQSIKRMDSTGKNVVTLASGFTSLSAMALDSSGNIYLTDNNTVKKMGPNGENITTLSNIGGFDIALDPSGNIYLAESGTNRILKLDSNGGNLTVISNGSRFTGISGLSVDSSGNIFVVDRGIPNGNLRKLNSSGVELAYIDVFRNPTGVAVDNFGNVYVSDIDYEFSDSGIYKTTGLSSTLSTTNVKQNSFALYPNPAKDFVTLNNLTKGSEVSIIDMNGKLLFKTKAADTVLTINTSSFANGVYLVKVNNNVSKLVVAK